MSSISIIQGVIDGVGHDLLRPLHNIFHILKVTIGRLHGVERFAHGFHVAVNIGELVAGVEHRSDRSGIIRGFIQLLPVAPILAVFAQSFETSLRREPSIR